MGIKIKYKDPKSTDFGPNDIVINVRTGTIFYKSEKSLFKLQGDNLNTPTDTIHFESNISASKGFFTGYGIGDMVVGSQNSDVFEVSNYTLEVKGGVFPTISAEPQYDLGSVDRPWRDVYVSEGSFKFVRKDRGIGFSRIGSTFIIGDYKFENVKEFSTFSKKNIDDLKRGKSLSGSGDLNVERNLILTGSLIGGTINGGSF